MKYFIANWKANKTYDDALRWNDEFSNAIQSDSSLIDALNSDRLTIIICPPFPFLHTLKPLEQLSKNIFIGAQSLSDKANGAFTGEVTAEMVQGLVQYSILGHSERRSNYGETNEMLAEKTRLSLAKSITPVFCVRDAQDTIPQGITFVAFEPVSAIGTGNNMNANEVLQKKRSLSLPQNSVFIYGGSVNPDTVSDYLHHDEIQGFLIGSASLTPSSFLDIVKKA